MAAGHLLGAQGLGHAHRRERRDARDRNVVGLGQEAAPDLLAGRDRIVGLLGQSLADRRMARHPQTTRQGARPPSRPHGLEVALALTHREHAARLPPEPPGRGQLLVGLDGPAGELLVHDPLLDARGLLRTELPSVDAAPPVGAARQHRALEPSGPGRVLIERPCERGGDARRRVILPHHLRREQQVVGRHRRREQAPLGVLDAVVRRARVLDAQGFEVLRAHLLAGQAEEFDSREQEHNADHDVGAHRLEPRGTVEGALLQRVQLHGAALPVGAVRSVETSERRVRLPPRFEEPETAPSS